MEWKEERKREEEKKKFSQGEDMPPKSKRKRKDEEVDDPGEVQSSLVEDMGHLFERRGSQPPGMRHSLKEGGRMENKKEEESKRLVQGNIKKWIRARPT